MRTLLHTALRRALRRPALFVGLWLITLLISYLASLPASWALHAVLDTQPLARPLSLGQLDHLWAEILSAHPTASVATLASLLGGAVLAWLIAACAAGGLIDALRVPGDPRRVIGRRVFARAAETAPAMLALGVWGLLLRAGLALLNVPVAIAFGKWAPGRGPWQTGLTLLSLGLCALLLWSTASVIVHYARVFRLAARPGQSRFPGASPRALLRALRHAARHPGPTLTLALFSLLGTSAIAAAGLGLLSWLNHAAGASLVLIFTLRQMFTLCRGALSLSVLAGAVSVADAGVEGADAEALHGRASPLI